MTRDIFEVQRKLKFGVELSFELVAHEGLVGGYPFASDSVSHSCNGVSARPRRDHDTLSQPCGIEGTGSERSSMA
jgi:hypothetical protein